MTLEEKLAEAEAKYHQLVIGEAARVIVDQNGERIEFTSTNIAKLNAYIQSLKNQIGGSTSAPMKVFM